MDDILLKKLYSLNEKKYKEKGVDYNTFLAAMTDTNFQQKVYDKYSDKFSAKGVSFRTFQIGLNLQPTRELGSLNDYIFKLESDPEDGYQSFNTNSKSGAVGGYQFIFDTNRAKEIKSKYGVNKDEFFSNPFVQEEYMNEVIVTQYAPNLEKYKAINKSKNLGLNDYELMYIMHHEGIRGGEIYLNTGVSKIGSAEFYEKQFQRGREYLYNVQKDKKLGGINSTQSTTIIEQPLAQNVDVSLKGQSVLIGIIIGIILLISYVYKSHVRNIFTICFKIVTINTSYTNPIFSEVQRRSLVVLAFIFSLLISYFRYMLHCSNKLGNYRYSYFDYIYKWWPTLAWSFIIYHISILVLAWILKGKNNN